MEQDNNIESEKEIIGGEAVAAPAENKTDESAEKRRKHIRDLCYIALCAAVMVICSWLYFNIPATEIPITLQTLGVCMTAGFLGWKRGTLSVLAYILLGICGIPVFSGYKNFYALIGSPSAGYVIGFIFTALIVGVATDKLRFIGDRFTNKVKSQIIQLVILAVAMVIGVAICYVFGTLWYLFIYKGSATAENLQIALTYCVYPYIVPDLIKIVAATVLVNRLKRYIK